MSAGMVTVIAIDGPAASGKGTIAAGVANDLGFRYLDSGSLYRLVALKALRHKIGLDDEAMLADAAANLDVEFEHGGVRLDGDGLAELLDRQVPLPPPQIFASQVQDRGRRIGIQAQGFLAQRRPNPVLAGGCRIDRHLQITEVQPNAVELYLDETFTNQLDLTNMLRPAAQPGSRLDYELPPEDVTVMFTSKAYPDVSSPGLNRRPRYVSRYGFTWARSCATFVL